MTPEHQENPSETRGIFLCHQGSVEGPYAPRDLQELLSRKELPPTTLSKYDDEGKESPWRPVSLLLSSALSANRTSISLPPLAGAHLPELATPTAQSAPAPQSASMISPSVPVQVQVPAAASPLPPRSSPKSRRWGAWTVGFVSLALIILAGGFVANRYLNSELDRIKREQEALVQEATESKQAIESSFQHEIAERESKFRSIQSELNSAEERAKRIQAELEEANEQLLLEQQRTTIVVALNKALTDKQDTIRESVLPATLLPKLMVLKIEFDRKMLKVDEKAFYRTLAKPLEAMGIEVVPEIVSGRPSLYTTCRVQEIVGSSRDYSAYSVNLNCYGMTWLGGRREINIIHSSSVLGLAGSHSKYKTQFMETAQSLGEELAERMLELRLRYDSADNSIFFYENEAEIALGKLRALKTTTDEPLAGATGSGFIISKRGLIVTNYHVIEGHAVVDVWVPSLGRSVSATVIASDRANDLALLRIASVDCPSNLVLPVIATRLPEVGQSVSTVGFPVPEIMGREPKYSQGVLNALSGGQGNVRVLQHSIPIQPGNSGGLLLSESGEICGVVQSTLNAMKLLGESGSLPQNVNYAIKSERLWDLLKAESLASELGEADRKPIGVKEAINLSVMIITPIKR